MSEIERMLGLMKRATRMWRIDEAAFLCDVSGRTIRRAIEENKIKAHNGRIPHSEVVRYCGGRDPFLEVQKSLETLNGEEGLRRTITHLERPLGQAQQAV